MASASNQGIAKALDEVVVTAQQRTPRLWDVPISISVMTGEMLDDSGIRTMETASQYIPNFKVSSIPIGDTISIRGVNSNLQAGGEQSVGTFVGGVFRGRGVQWSRGERLALT